MAVPHDPQPTADVHLATIAAPAAASALGHLRLVGSTVARSEGDAVRAVVFGCALVGVVVALLTNWAAAVLWLAPVVILAEVVVVVSILAWWSLGKGDLWLCVGPGHVEVRTPTGSTWYPAGSMRSWSVNPTALAVVVRSGLVYRADARGYGGGLTDAAVAWLLEQPPPAEPASGRVVAEWVHSAEVARARVRSSRRGDRWWWAKGLGVRLASVALIGLPVLIALAAHEVLAAGWDDAVERFSADGAWTVGAVVALSALLVAAVALASRRAARRRDIGVPVAAGVTEEALVLSDGNGVRSTIAWPAIHLVQLDDDCLSVRTVRPRRLAAIPVAAVRPGELDDLLQRLEAGRATDPARARVPFGPSVADGATGERST